MTIAKTHTTTHTHTISALMPSAAATPVLTFRLDQQFYALRIEEVVEVAPMMETVRIAGAHPHIIGVVNRHGKPLPLLDLRLTFEHPAPPLTSQTLFVVVQAKAHQVEGGVQVGLIVDEVLQVEYIAVPNSLTGGTRFIEGILTQPSRLLQLVAAEPLLTAYLARELEA